jgi:hypothetical protein
MGLMSSETILKGLNAPQVMDEVISFGGVVHHREVGGNPDYGNLRLVSRVTLPSPTNERFTQDLRLRNSKAVCEKRN